VIDAQGKNVFIAAAAADTTCETSPLNVGIPNFWAPVFGGVQASNAAASQCLSLPHLENQSQQGRGIMSHCGLAIYIKKYLKTKRRRIMQTQKISPCKNYI
jgi:hypothetical protein